MAGNTRGKLKEQLGGVHNNFNWSLKHIDNALVLIKDHKPELREALLALSTGVTSLDDLTMSIYSKL